MELSLIVIFVLAAGFYCCSSALYIYQVFKRTDRYATVRRLFFLGGLIAHSVLIGLFSFLQGGTVLGGVNILMLSSWALVIIYAIFELISKTQSYGAFIVPLALVVMCVAWFMGLSPDALRADVYNDIYGQWPFLTLHVGAFIIAAGCFFISGAASIMLLYQSHLLKTRKADFVGAKMPSLSALKKVAGRAVLIGLPIFTMGLLLGVSHAFVSGNLMAVSTTGAVAYLSPRIMLSVLLWLLYVVYLYVIYCANVSSRKGAWMSVVGAVATVVLTFMSATLPMLNG